MSDKALIDAGELTKPATVLIEKISGAIGILYEPTRIKKKAIAESEASKTKAIVDLEIQDIQKRALNRLVSEEIKKQENIESITGKSLPLLNEDAEPDNIEDDWISNFFDKCKLISDDEMQTIWSSILSGEANSPGTYSKRTISFLANLDKKDAVLFSKFCGYLCQYDELIPFIYDHANTIYKKHNITFENLSHLSSIGLIQYHSLGLEINELPKEIIITYFGEIFKFEMSNDENNNLSIGNAFLTQIGKELALILNAEPVEGFREYLIEKWKEKGYKVN